MSVIQIRYSPFRSRLRAAVCSGVRVPLSSAIFRATSRKALVHLLGESHALQGLQMRLYRARISPHYRAGERSQRPLCLYILQGGPYDRVEGRKLDADPLHDTLARIEERREEVADEDGGKVIEHLVLARNPDRLTPHPCCYRAKHGKRPLLAFDEDVRLGQNRNACLYVGECLEGVKGAEQRALCIQRTKLCEGMGAARMEEHLSRKIYAIAGDALRDLFDLPVLGGHRHHVGHFHDLPVVEGIEAVIADVRPRRIEGCRPP